MLLTRYLASHIGRGALMAGGVLVGLFSFLDLLFELADVSKGGTSLNTALLYVGLRVPSHLYQLLPVATLLGALFALSQLVRDAEYPVMRVAGLSLARLAGMLTRIGLLFTLLTFVLGEVIVPYSEDAGRRNDVKVTHGITADRLQSGLWLRDGPRFVNVLDVTPDHVVHGLKLYEFDSGYKLTRVITGQTARYGKDGWTIDGVKSVRLAPDHVEVQEMPTAHWNTDLTPDVLNVLVSVPEKMSVWQLYHYIRFLNANGQDTQRHQIALWSKLGYPLTCIALILLALPFAQYQKRSGGAGLRLLVGTLLGILFYLVNKLTAHMGLLYQWPAVYAGLSPTAVLILIATGTLWWQEYGKVRLGR